MSNWETSRVDGGAPEGNIKRKEREPSTARDSKKVVAFRGLLTMGFVVLIGFYVEQSLFIQTYGESLVRPVQTYYSSLSTNLKIWQRILTPGMTVLIVGFLLSPLR